MDHTLSFGRRHCKPRIGEAASLNSATHEGVFGDVSLDQALKQCNMAAHFSFHLALINSFFRQPLSGLK